MRSIHYEHKSHFELSRTSDCTLRHLGVYANPISHLIHIPTACEDNPLIVIPSK